MTTRDSQLLLGALPTENGRMPALAPMEADGVMAEFAALRRAVLDLLDRGAALAGVLGTNAAQVGPFFAAARAGVDQSRLNLTVIGAEGVGKSTLINAVAGADLTPRERDHPGTVAPTYAEAGTESDPVYLVMLRNEQGREAAHQCAGLEEFRRYLLQHENRDNQRGVLRGVVRYDHPALRRGLRLVDMPGVHASSPLVNQEARRFLAEETHAVVAVTYGRTGFGALHEVFRELEVGRDLVQAVVINQELGYFATSGLELLPDAELRPRIEQTRRAAAEELGIPAERTFVLNLASYYESRTHGRPPLASPAHTEELARFERHLWGYIRGNGVADVIDRAADDVTTALHALYARLDVAARALNALATGDKGTAKRVQGEYRSARERAEAGWRRVAGPDVALSVAAQGWPALKSAADQARDQIAAAVDGALAELNATGGRVSARRAGGWKERVQDVVLRERESLDRAYGEALRAALEYYTAHADAAIGGVYEQVPLLAESAPADRLMVSSGGLVLAGMGRMEPGAIDHIAKWGSAGGAGLLGGKLAGGGGTALLVAALGINPLTALVAGGVAGMSGALLLWRFVRDEHRDAVQSGLTRFRTSVLAALDTSPGGTLRQEWEAAVSGISTRVEGYLAGQLAEVGALLSAPAESRATWQSRLAALEGTLAQVDGLRADLDHIRARAEMLDVGQDGEPAMTSLV